MDNSPLSTARDMISDSAALLELSGMLNASADLDFILGNVLLSSMGKLMIGRGIVLVETADGLYKLRTMKGISAAVIQREFRLPADWCDAQYVDDLMTTGNEDIREFAACCLECGIDLILPMRLDHRLVGIAGFGSSITGKSFERSEITFLESVSAIAATAVQGALTIETLRLVNRSLDTKIQEMNTLFELSREMNRLFEEDQILKLLGYALMGQLRVLRYVVFAFDAGKLRALSVKLPGFEEQQSIQDNLTELTDTVHFSDSRSPETEAELWLADLGIRVILPMRSQDETRGILCLGERMGTDSYDDSEIEYLDALANLAVSALENARLVKETLEKQRMEQQLQVAKSIQKGLLPNSIPDIEGYRISAINESSQEVGGDYYEVLPLSDHEIVLAIADVSGKGIPASLLMANVQAALRTIAPLRLPLTEATTRINTLIFDNTAMDKFITFFWGVLDTRAHTFEYVNAGHNPPYLLRSDGSHESLDVGGLILGIMEPPPPYQFAIAQLLPGDTIVTYTDGVNEAMSANMEEFGDERFLALLKSLHGQNSDEIINGVKREIIDFTVGAPQSDDITMLTIQRLAR